jgi:hypothetical protein
VELKAVPSAVSSKLTETRYIVSSRLVVCFLAAQIWMHLKLLLGGTFVNTMLVFSGWDNYICSVLLAGSVLQDEHPVTD